MFLPFWVIFFAVLGHFLAILDHFSAILGHFESRIKSAWQNKKVPGSSADTLTHILQLCTPGFKGDKFLGSLCSVVKTLIVSGVRPTREKVTY